MWERCVKDLSLRMDTPGDALVAIMGCIQHDHPVPDFPPAHHPVWQQVVFRISQDPGLEGFLSWDFDIESVLDDVTIMDPKTERIRVDPNDSRGLVLAHSCPAAAQRIFKIADETRDFIQFG